MQQDSTTHGNGSTAIDARFSASFKLPQSNVTRNDFSSLAQSIGNNTQKISYNTTQLRKYVDQLGTEADTERMREKLHRLQNVNNQLAKDTNEIFKQISDLPVGDQKEQQHRKIHIRRLKEEFSAVLQEFQKLQREATGKEKESVARARVNSDFGPSSITWSYAPDVPGIHSSPPSTKDSSLQQTQQQVYEIEESVDLAIIEEREKGIQQLEKDINDINEIFRDLAQMVNEQGEQIGKDTKQSAFQMAASYGRGTGGFESYQGGGGGGYGNDYMRLTQSISNNIQKISNNVKNIRRMVNQIGTPQDSDQLRDRLHESQHQTNDLAKSTTQYFKDISHLPVSSNQSDQRQRKMQRERLMEDFTSLLNEFQTLQREAANKEKASVRRARAASGHDSAFLEGPREQQIIDIGGGPPSRQQTLQMEEDVDLQLIQERETAIKQLESDIMDVNQIFKDLGMLVHEQGEVIDSIEANVESAQIQVEAGTEQLAKARDYQSKARRKKCCLITILIVVLAVIALIIGLSVGLKNK
ncbi:syntaxin-12 [Lingula anatina]|uniref:Syntaxin-7 n=1 Tax=Lingula anatina TaxID=7574 RepID=A0A1S3J3Y4_LINAN|nr:syntaxin-12 [Lingula anatina]|eukprot:XP_013404976.1 syntaxin-12 [Lingula anatina]